MRRLIPTWGFGLLVLALLVPCALAQVTVEGSCVQRGGWMPDGWGSYRLVIRNAGTMDVTALRWTAHWEAAGTALGDPWEERIDQDVPAGGQIEVHWDGYLPPDVVERSKPDAPLMVGTVSIEDAGVASEVPCGIEIPAAYLPEPLRTAKGRHVDLALMESRYATFDAQEATLAWLDGAYEAMADLTGGTPYEGRTIPSASAASFASADSGSSASAHSSYRSSARRASPSLSRASPAHRVQP